MEPKQNIICITIKMKGEIKMGKVIMSGMFRDKLRLEENNRPDDEMYGILSKKFDSEFSKLSEEEQDKFSKLLELHLGSINYEVEEAFCRGLTIGLRLFAEAFSVDLN